MRFGSLYLDGFGIHRDLAFELDEQAPLVLFTGLNEAGKSTVMGFIRTMLFGFPTRARMPERYEPAGGGSHGGHLTLIDAQGTPIRLERYDKSGYPKLFYPDGTQAGEAELKRLLGGLTPELYRNLFAFSLSELHRLETLQGDEISGFLYGSGTGISGSAVVQAEKNLAARMDQLFKPRGTRQQINLVLKDLDELDAQIRNSKEQSSRYNDLVRELDELDAHIAAKGEELQQWRRQAEWLNKCAQAREAWLDLRSMDRELAEKPERYVLAPEAEALLAERTELDHWVKEAGNVARLRIERAELRRQLDNVKEAMARQLREIDPSWTIEDARKFPFAIVRQDEMDAFGERFERLQAGIAAAEAGLATLDAEGEQLAGQAEAEGKHVAERESELEARLPAEALADPDGFAASMQRAWAQVKEDAAAWQMANRNHADAKRSLDALPAAASTALPGITGLLMLAAVIIAGLAAGLLHLLSGEPLLAYGIGGLLLIAGLAAVFPMKRSLQGRRDPLADMRRSWSLRLAEAESELADAADRFRASRSHLMDRLAGFPAAAEAAAAGGADGDPQDAMRQLAPLMEQWEREMAGWRRLAAELDEARRMLDRTRKALDGWNIRRRQQADHLNRLKEELAACHNEWAAWLDNFGLPGHVRPASLKLMRQYAEQALDKADQAEKLSADLDKLRKEEEACRQGALALLDKHRLCLEKQTGQAVRLDGQDDGWRDALMRLAGLAEDYAAIRQRREEMEQQRRERLRLLDAWIPEAQRAYMERLLLDHDADQLDALLKDAREKAEAAEAALRQLNEQRGGQKRELDRLLLGEGHADLLLAGEGKTAELEELAGHYSIAAMAALLIRKAREIHERERQPGVLRRASHYFSRMTRGRYVKVFSPMGEKDILAETANGQRMPSAMLSRGTAEQLYLAMRFALAEEYEKIVSLPLVMDDIFVNFDSRRLKETLVVLAEVAERRQILLFTCHEHVAEAVKAAMPASQQIELPYSS